MSLETRTEPASGQDRFMAVAFTEIWPAPSDMPEWHQHLTIFPWVRGDLAAMGQLLEQFAPVMRPIAATVVEAVDSDKPEAPMPIWLVGPTPVLRGLHKVCLAFLTNVANLEDTTFTGAGYTPYITKNPLQPELMPGDHLEIKAISLIQKVGQRQLIAKTVEFGDA